MRRLLALLLLLPTPAMAQLVDTAQNNNNNNQAVGQASSNQSNVSRSESVGGNLNNYQINNAQGDFGEMGIGTSGVNCDSPSFYINGGVIPSDAWGFYTFEDRNREMMYAPQAQVGFQMPFGPQVAACVDAMKHQSTQIQVSTEAGVLTKCLTVKKQLDEAKVPIGSLAKQFPNLTKNCAVVWQPEIDWLQPDA